MGKCTAEELQKVCGGKWLQQPNPSAEITELLLDSRRLVKPSQTLFFAISGKLDGHNYLNDLYQLGVRNFVVQREVDVMQLPDANVLQVLNTVHALQKLTAWHRAKFDLPVIAITGSNGKTIVKEWLYQLLQEDYNIVRSPKSYNSQTGVPLSVWQMNEQHTLGIFEAGISEPDEMEKLQRVLQPTIGIFTNMGEAHSEGFLNIRHKTKEKLRLFTNVQTLIYCSDYADINTSVAEINSLTKGLDNEQKIKTFTWSHQAQADLRVLSVMQNEGRSYINATYQQNELDFIIPFTDKASVENALHCVTLMLYLGTDVQIIKARLLQLSGIQMRLEMKEAINNCTLINDAYNSDVLSLRIALEFMAQQQKFQQRTVILSDILQSGKSEPDLYDEVSSLLRANSITRLIGIGPALMRQQKLFEKNDKLQVQCFETTDGFVKQLDTALFQNEIVLLKGARKFRFEIIAKLLERQAHETVLEINLTALASNLKAYRTLLKPGVKVMAMVKAFSYGSGSFEIANLLQFHRVDYLAVAYADEGVELRKAGITLPIMVMNPEQRSFDAIIRYQLEPNIYSLSLLNRFMGVASVLRSSDAPPIRIHLELETGMHRLGFDEKDLEELSTAILLSEDLKIASVFSHLAGSEDPKLDAFTEKQIALFEKMSNAITAKFSYPILRHLANSHGISRHPNAHFDMVRPGIGLYGIDESEAMKGKLQPVSSLRTTISQLKQLKKGDTVGYGRHGKVKADALIATVGIGYADGLPRSLGNGKGRMLLRGEAVPIIGNVCMDMTMLDVTQLKEVAEGDEVQVFGNGISIESLADASGTIAYEILTGISQRVKRVYVQE